MWTVGEVHGIVLKAFRVFACYVFCFDNICTIGEGRVFILEVGKGI